MLKIWKTQMRDQKKITVTVFGSCRQDSVYKDFDVTSIRDGLTYPHYTKEIIQAIKFCNGSSPDSLLTAGVFRNTLLGLNTSSRKKLSKDFRRTDVFLVEIASSLVYKSQGLYFHHIAKDFTDDLNFNKSIQDLELPAIEVCRQSTEEIEHDMDEIVALLHPKAVLFISHFSTKGEGVRADLAKVIREYSALRGFRFFDPTVLLENYELKDLVIEEPVISHFSEFGHKILSYRYKTIIRDATWNLDHTLLVQKYTSPIDSRIGIHGFGDYLVGVLGLLEICSQKELTLRVDFGEHPISDFLRNRHIEAGWPKMIFNDEVALKSNIQGPIFTNRRPVNPVQDEYRDFLRLNCLTLLPELKEYLSEVEGKLQLNDDFVVLHVRLGDKYGSWQRNIPQLEMELLNSEIAGVCERFSKGKRVLVLSDSEFLLEHLDNSFTMTTGLKRGHTGNARTERQATKDTLTEFFLMCKAKEILSLSVFPWGSGFSEIASIVSGVVLHRLDNVALLKIIPLEYDDNA
jgi:hypothetical protein